MANLKTPQPGNRRVQFQEFRPRSTRGGFFSDTSEGTVADRDTTDAETDWTDWEAAPQRPGNNRKAEVFPILTSAEQRAQPTTGRVTRASTLTNERPRPQKRSARSGRVSPVASQEIGPSKRRKDDSEFSESESGPRFACPFFKKDPQKYKTHRTCPGPGWTTVHRVKEHLYRRHSQPTYCPKCYRVFAKDALLNAHLRANQCPVLAGEPPEGLTNEQKEKLKKRGLPSQSEEDRWREVYRILFPDVDEADIPSAYHDDHQNGSDSIPFRQELLRRVRRELLASANGKASEAEVRVMRQVADIVRKCESELLQPEQQPPREESSSDFANDAPSMPSSEYWPSTADEESDAPSASFASNEAFPHYSHGVLVNTVRGSTPAANDVPSFDHLGEDSIPQGYDWTEHVNFDDWLISGESHSMEDSNWTALGGMLGEGIKIEDAETQTAQLSADEVE
jgi:hypothetical protein